MMSEDSYNKLWHARQLLYDLNIMNEQQLRNLIFTYIFMKEYGINSNTTVEELYSVKSRIEKEASTTDYKVKALTLKKLDILLTLIALKEAENKQV